MIRSLFFAILFLSTPSFANVNGSHLQNFNPTTNGLDFVTVQSSQTLLQSHFNFGLYFDEATNSLPFFKAAGVASNQKFSEPNDKLLSGHFNLGFGLLENWEVGLSLPVVLAQDIGNSTSLGSYDDTGLTEFRINTKYSPWRAQDMGTALIASVNFNRINNNPFSGSDPGASFNLEAVYDYKIAPQILWALNLGYRIADPGSPIADTDVTPLGDQLLYSTAISYEHLPWNTFFIAEVFGSDFTESASLPTDRKLNNLELVLAARKSFFKNIAFTGGIGTELYHGFASPDLRLFLGANWLVGPIQAAAPPPPVLVSVPKVETVYDEAPSETIILSSINFDTNKSQMTAASRDSMNGPLQSLLKNKESLRLIIVDGHTDNVGTDSFNKTLSEKRAKAVRDVLIKELNLAENQVQARGFGESQPVSTNETEEGKRKNRRVELKIYRNQ